MRLWRPNDGNVSHAELCQQQAAAPVASTSTTPGPNGCGNQYAGYNNPCYLTYTATISVAQAEKLYVNGALASSPYTSTTTENWGTGSCQNIQGSTYCFGYATPPAITAYATETGYANSVTITVY